MTKMMKKICSICVAFMMLVMSPMIVSAAESNVYIMNENSEYIDIGTLSDEEPITVIYYLNSESNFRNSEYIVFSMTRSSVNWSCVGVPNDQIFSGKMSITNITTGMSCGSNISMIGRSGSTAYFGIDGHKYHMSFSGALWKTDSNGMVTEKVSNESGGWSWQIPIKTK